MGSVQEDVLEIQRIFKGLVPGFGLNHARILQSLLFGQAKDASQLMRETGVRSAKTYQILADLVKAKVLRETNTRPAVYYVEDPIKVIDRQIKSRVRDLEQKKLELKKIILNGDSGVTEEYLIQVQGKQTKLFNNKTKQAIEDEYEVKVIKRLLEKVPTKKEEKYGVHGYYLKKTA